MTCTRIFLGALSVAVLATPALTAQTAPGCEEWNTKEFFEASAVEDVTACLASGADPTARGKVSPMPSWRFWTGLFDSTRGAFRNSIGHIPSAELDQLCDWQHESGLN